MNAIKPKFNKADQPEFFRVLNKRVDQYFKENNLSKKANLRMVVKTIVMLSLYFIPFVMILMGYFSSFGGMLLLWAIMGLGMAGIGLSVMHDANHKAYSTNDFINRAVGFIINFMGCYHETWKIQHNVLHHSYTNIQGFDEDVDNEVIRFSPEQPIKSFHQYQLYYAPFLYCLMSLNRFVVKDFQQLVRFNKEGLLEGQGLTFASAMAQTIFHKVWYILLTIVLPMVLLDVPVWYILVGFLVMHLICGFMLAVTFETAHIVEETKFYSSDENGSIENHWAIHQLRTTSNFANGNPFISWFFGGLNFQIEHHLFPNICHVHYKHLSPIVQQTTREFDLPYNHHPTLFGAIKSHFMLLDQLGKGKL